LAFVWKNRLSFLGLNFPAETGSLKSESPHTTLFSGFKLQVSGRLNSLQRSIIWLQPEGRKA